MVNFIKSPILQEGNKCEYLSNLVKYFPNFDVFIEPFCGTGNVFLNVHNCYKLINDHNKLIYWTFCVLQTERGPKEIAKEIGRLPVYKPFLTQKTLSLVKRIAQSLVLSRVSFLGHGETIKLQKPSSINLLVDSLLCWRDSYLKGAVFACKFYSDFLNEISFRQKREEKRAFVYCDPPYVFEKGNLNLNRRFKEKDLNHLLELLNKKDWKYAISCRNKGAEFFAKNGLFVEKIMPIKRRFKTNNKQKEYEFLAMNYKLQPELF